MSDVRDAFASRRRVGVLDVTKRARHIPSADDAKPAEVPSRAVGAKSATGAIGP